MLWRLGGAKDAEDSLFTDLVGQDVAGARPRAGDDAENLLVTTQVSTVAAMLSAQGHALIERIGGEGVRTDTE